jgi:protein-S-isoprenylcysteine O-methyltransferase Ste14
MRWLQAFRAIAWIACAVYATIPSFWLLIHPRAEYWRARPRSPYRVLLPLWAAMWIFVAAITKPWREVVVFYRDWCWIPAAGLFCAGLLLYKLSGSGFTLAQLGGTPEILPGHCEQRLVTTGIRARVRHPVYLAHLCEMLAWTVGTGLAVCWALTAFAMVTGAVMIRMEDYELEKRFGEELRKYRSRVPGIVPIPRGSPESPL